MNREGIAPSVFFVWDRTEMRSVCIARAAAPGAGGQRFATMQCVAWTLFFAFMLASLADLRDPAREAFETFSDNVPEWGKWVLDDAILATFERASRFFWLHLA